MDIDPQKESVIPLSRLIGDAGFPGSHFWDRFIGAGHEVICMDSLLTGSFENVRRLLSHSRFTFVQHDVTRPIDLAGMLGNKAENSAHANGVPQGTRRASSHRSNH